MGGKSGRRGPLTRKFGGLHDDEIFGADLPLLDIVYPVVKELQHRDVAEEKHAKNWLEEGSVEAFHL